MKCKVEKICGGCSLLKLKPSMQADKKKKDVEELVEKAPTIVKAGIKGDEAETFKVKLSDAGATVTLK